MLVSPVVALLAVRHGAPDASDPFGCHPIGHLVSALRCTESEALDAIKAAIGLGYLETDLGEYRWWTRGGHKILSEGYKVMLADQMAYSQYKFEEAKRIADSTRVCD